MSDGAKPAQRTLARKLSGRWRIEHMDEWDRDAIDLEGPAFIEIAAGGTGRFRFIAVEGELDCRFDERGGRPRGSR